MEPIASHRAAHLLPYLALLQKIGAPVERRLGQARLPTMLADETELHLPLLRTLDFLSEMAHAEGINDLALRAREQVGIEELGPDLRSLIYSAPTLKRALEAVFRLATMETSCLELWMVQDASNVRICNSYHIPFDAERIRHCELDTNVIMVAIVRAFAGSAWYPATMGFVSNVPLGRYASERFPNTRFLVGQKTAWIELPRALLSFQPRATVYGPGPASPAHPRLAASAKPPTGDFPGSLKRVLHAYLMDGYPDIRLAAEIACTSVRTLQRRLAEFGLNYSELVQQVRFEAAARMLEDSGNKVIDVACELGWTDSSHFARAFRRMAGVSPREYRTRQRLE